MIQRGIAFLALVITITFLTGCTGLSENYAELTVAEVDKRIRESASMSRMQRGDDDRLMKLYGIETDELTDYVLYLSESNVQADELAVIKLKNSNETDRTMALIRQRIADQTIKFKDYRPVEHRLVERHVLKVKGPFIFFAVSEEADRMERAFDDAMRD